MSGRVIRAVVCLWTPVVPPTVDRVQASAERYGVNPDALRFGLLPDPSNCFYPLGGPA